MSNAAISRPLTIAEILTTRQTVLGLTDHHLAVAMGYTSPNVIALIKSRQMRLPVNKVRAFADALEVERGEVLRLVLAETSPCLLESIEDCLGPLLLTPTEARLITRLRETAQGQPSSPLFLDGNSIVAVITRQ